MVRPEHPCAWVPAGTDAILAFSRSATGVEFCFVMQKLKIVALNSAHKVFLLLLCSLLGQEEPSFGDAPVFMNNALPFCPASSSLWPLNLVVIPQIPKPGDTLAAREVRVLGGDADLESAPCLLGSLWHGLRLTLSILSPLGMEQSRTRTPSRPPRSILICGSTSLCRTGCWTLGVPLRW